MTSQHQRFIEASLAATQFAYEELCARVVALEKQRLANNKQAKELRLEFTKLDVAYAKLEERHERLLASFNRFRKHTERYDAE